MHGEPHEQMVLQKHIPAILFVTGLIRWLQKRDARNLKNTRNAIQSKPLPRI